MSLRTDVSTKGPMFPQKDRCFQGQMSLRTDVSTKGLMCPGTNVSTLLIYLLVSFDFVVVYDCVCVRVRVRVRVSMGSLWKH